MLIISKDTAQVNEGIKAKEFLLISQNGEQLGVKTKAEAMQIAERMNLDVVLVAPNAKTPVAKIMNYGKFKFEQQKKEKEARAAKENAAVDKAIENAEMDIPDAMLNTQVRQMLDDFSRRMQSQGLTMEQYFQFTGMTLDKMQEEMKPQALKRIQTRLVLEKIAEVENIQPTEEEVEEEFKKMADAYKMEVEKIKELLGDRELEQMKKDMAVQKAVTLVADEAKEA